MGKQKAIQRNENDGLHPVEKLKSVKATRHFAGTNEFLMELKVVCQCGQKYKFDVEPVGNRMPFTVNCPVCNLDGTAAANALIAGQPAGVSPAFAPPPTIARVSSGLKINRSAPEPDTAVAILPMAPENSGSVPPPISGLRPGKTDKKSKPKVEGEFSLWRGILGAVLGTGVGCGLMFAFWLWAHFRFPLMGVAVRCGGQDMGRAGWRAGRRRPWGSSRRSSRASRSRERLC